MNSAHNVTIDCNFCCQALFRKEVAQYKNTSNSDFLFEHFELSMKNLVPVPLLFLNILCCDPVVFEHLFQLRGKFSLMK